MITDLTNPFEALHSNFGFSLIPIQPGTKMPGLDSWAKFQDEQCQINDLRRWIRNFSAFAVITGPVSGVVVVDLDGPDALAWAEENLTPTPWIVLTGAKGEFRGQHWYYLWPDDLADGVSVRNRGRVKHNGKKLELDIRGEGGYVLAPGSPHMDGGFYEATRVWTHADDVPTFNPSWFPEEARPAALPRTLSRDAQKMEQRFIRWLERKEFPAKGQRNHETHQAACSGYDFGLSHDTVLQHVMAWNDMSPDPLPWKEVQTTVRSAEKSKQAPRYPKGEIEDRETFFERMKAERQASMTREEANRQEVLEALVKSTKSYAESGVKAQPQEQLDLAQETEDDYYDAHPIGDDPTDMDEDSVPDASPEGMDARIYTERNFISQSFDNHAISMVLASFSDEDWKDHASKYVARAIKRTAEGHDVKDKEGFTRTIVSNACKEDNSWAEWQTILDFWGRYVKDSKPSPSAAYKAMRDACDWDLGSALLLKYAETLHKGKFGDWVTGLHEDVVTLLASAQTIHQKTLEDHVEEWLDDLINERPSRDTFRLELISHRIGDLGGGDVIPIVGPPKTGKSSIAMELATDAAKTTKKRHAPIKSLVGQLEMRMDQVARREVAKILGKKSDDVSPEEAKDLKASGRLGHLKHIRMTSRCTTLKSYRAEVSRILAANRDIKLWITDYAECIQKFGDNANRTDESEAIAKMIKELAIAFDVCAILLIQPTKQYSQEGHLGPKPYHAKNSGKWEQDAQAMLFIHSPARFYADMPKEYLELHVLCGRDCEKSVIPLRWSPATFSYDYWSGDVPEPKSQPYDSQGQQGGDDISKWAKKKQRKPTGKQLDMNSSWSSEQDY